MASEYVRCVDCGRVFDIDDSDNYRQQPDGTAICEDQGACVQRALNRHGGQALLERVQQLRQNPAYPQVLQAALGWATKWATDSMAAALPELQRILARLEDLDRVGEPTPEDLAEGLEDYGGQQAWPVETRILAPEDLEGLGEQDLAEEQQQEYSDMIGQSLQGWNQGRD